MYINTHSIYVDIYLQNGVISCHAFPLFLAFAVARHAVDHRNVATCAIGQSPCPFLTSCWRLGAERSSQHTERCQHVGTLLIRQNGDLIGF